MQLRRDFAVQTDGFQYSFRFRLHSRAAHKMLTTLRNLEFTSQHIDRPGGNRCLCHPLKRFARFG